MCAPAIGVAISAISTGFGMFQGIQQANYQQQQAAMAQRHARQQYAAQQQQQAMEQQAAAAQQQSQYNNAVTQNRYQNLMAIRQHEGQVKAQQASVMGAERQMINNANAANRGYTAEQLKLKEARDKAAFRAQDIYAKQIGAMGKVLASGQSGKSVQRRAFDTERQAGFALSKNSASLRSKETQTGLTMEGIGLQNESANNQAENQILATPTAPYLSPDPVAPGMTYTGNMGIPSYNWT